MTSLSLLLWIVSGIALQLAAFIGFSFWRHRRGFRILPGQAAEPAPPLLTARLVPASPAPTLVGFLARHFRTSGN